MVMISLFFSVGHLILNGTSQMSLSYSNVESNICDTSFIRQILFESRNHGAGSSMASRTLVHVRNAAPQLLLSVDVPPQAAPLPQKT